MHVCFKYSSCHCTLPLVSPTGKRNERKTIIKPIKTKKECHMRVCKLSTMCLWFLIKVIYQQDGMNTILNSIPSLGMLSVKTSLLHCDRVRMRNSHWEFFEFGSSSPDQCILSDGTIIEIEIRIEWLDYESNNIRCCLQVVHFTSA